MTLFPSYNLEIENYKDRHWLINPWSKLGVYVTRWEDVRHPPFPIKPVFETMVANIHITSSNMLSINLHIEFNVCACDKP